MTLDESIKQYKKDFEEEGFDASLPTEEPTYMDEIVGALDHGADVVSGMVGGFLNTGQTLVDRVTGVPEDEMIRAAEAREKQFDYIPRTDIGQEYSDTGKELLGKGMSAMGEWWKDNRESLGPTINSAIDYTEEQWNALSEKDRMAISAGTELGAVAFGGAAASAAKTAANKTASGVKTAFNKIEEANRFVPPSDLADPLDINRVPRDNSDVPQLEPEPVPVSEQLRLPASRPSPTLNVDELGYTSGIEEGIIAMLNDPKVPNSVNAAQLLPLLKKRGAKDDEIEWSTFSDYVDTLGNKPIPLDEALRQAKNRSITLEVIEVPNPKNSMFFKYNTAGGENYKELLFEFDTDTEGLEKSIIDLKENERPKLEEEYRSLQKERARLLAPRLNAMQVQQKKVLEDPDQDVFLTTQEQLRQQFNVYQQDMDDIDVPPSGRMSYEEFRDDDKSDKAESPTFGEAEESAYEIELAADMELDVTPRAAEVTRRILEISRELTRKRAELRAITFNEGHHKNDQNIIFHTRITDRNIGGGKSLAIDEIQSDWHKTNKDVPVQDRYYRLPEGKLVKKVEDNIEKAKLLYKDAKAAADLDRDIIAAAEDDIISAGLEEYGDLEITSVAEAAELGLSLKEARKVKGAERNSLILLKTIFPSKEELDGYYARLIAEQKTTDNLKSHEAYLLKLDKLKDIDKRDGTNVAYQKWTRELKPDAPLKNREKWMAAALNAMLFKAVKEGYDSVSWPNGRSQVVRYWGNDSTRTLDEHSKIRQEALSSIYDVAVPTALQKMAKKMDKNAKIEFGKQSKDSNPRPIPKSKVSREDFDIAKNDYEHYKRTGNNGAYGKRLKFPEFKEKYFSGTDADGSYFDATNSAYSHIKITPAMKEAILKGKALFNKGGLVENEMEAMGFAEGGLPKRTVPYGGSTNPSDQLGDIEFRSEMDEQLSWNALARLGYDPKISKVIDAGEGSYTAAYFPIDNDATTEAVQGQLQREGVSRQDYSRVKGGDIMLSSTAADEPIWSHEYTHRGIKIVRAKALEDPVSFLTKYGEKALDFLLSGRSDEFTTEMFDDTSARTDSILKEDRYPEDDPRNEDDVRGIRRTIQFADSNQSDYRRDKLRGDLQEGVPIEDSSSRVELERQLNQAAIDILKEQGEPDKVVPKEKSIWDIFN